MFGEGDAHTLLQQARDNLAELHTGTPEDALSSLFEAVAAIPAATNGSQKVVLKCDALLSNKPVIEYAVNYQPVGHVARDLTLKSVGARLDGIEVELTGRHV